MQKQARITSKGQITVPRDIRRTLGVRAGDRLLFESDSPGVRDPTPEGQESLREIPGHRKSRDSLRPQRRSPPGSCTARTMTTAI